MTQLIEVPIGYQGEVSISDKVTEIQSWIDLEKIEGLTSLEVDANNKNYSSVDGVLYNKQKTELIFAPIGVQGHVTVPEGITSVDFKGRTKLVSVVLPNSLTFIKNSAFAKCASLTSVVIPESVTKIDNFAFEHCTSLTSVVLPKEATSIGYAAFRGCTNLSSVVMPKGVDPSIGKDVFGSILFTAYVPCGLLESYKTVPFWSVQKVIETSLDFAPNISVAADSMGTAQITVYPDCTTKEATIVATPNAGFHFVKWNDGNTNATRKMVLTPETELVAAFALGNAPTPQNTLSGSSSNENKVGVKQKIENSTKVEGKKNKNSKKTNSFDVKRSIDVQKDIKKSVKK